MKLHRLVFIRNWHDDIRVAVCTFTSESSAPPLEQLVRALTQWAQTEEGWQAWRDSSEDFNIGDASNVLSAATLEPYGIHSLNIDMLDSDNAVSYDKVLMNFYDFVDSRGIGADKGIPYDKALMDEPREEES